MISPLSNFQALNLGTADVATGAGLQSASSATKPDAAREAFDQFVGGTFYRQMLSAMQKTVGKPAYLHGGQAEEMFRSELNSQLADHMSAATAGDFTGPMFELFNLQRR